MFSLPLFIFLELCVIIITFTELLLFLLFVPLAFLTSCLYPLSLLDATTPHPLIMKKTEIIHSTFVQHQNKNAFVITLNLNSLLQLPEEKLSITMFSM